MRPARRPVEVAEQLDDGLGDHPQAAHAVRRDVAIADHAPEERFVAAELARSICEEHVSGWRDGAAHGGRERYRVVVRACWAKPS
jgi:hypothetical protein